MNGGVFIVPPCQHEMEAQWYKGTANAIYQNTGFIDSFDPEYVLVLSGDHIYKMDYSKLLKFHKKKNADCTVAVINVPLEEASRFGIMNTNEDNQITSFEEKPKQPKSTLASMGIYIFNWSKLKQYLQKDAQNPESQNDFGKNIIPTMLSDGNKMFAYPFSGYWKDVGTIESLWEANMDMISSENVDLFDKGWKIYSRSNNYPPHFISEYAEVKNSLIAEGCIVDGIVNKSVLFAGVKIGKNAKINNSVLMPGVVIEDGADVEYSIVSENSVIKSNAHIGGHTDNGTQRIAVIGSDVTVGSGANIGAGEIIEENIPESATK